VARVLLIFNPAASRTHDGMVRDIERVFTGRGWKAESVATSGHGDARALAAYGVEQGVDVVVTLGGDGTVMQAASALVGKEIPLGILPGGTGNQLAGNLRLSFNPIRAAAALIDGEARGFDLGRLERSGESLYFAVAGGAGLDARVMADTAPRHKRKWGTMAYVATTLRLLPEVACVPFVVDADGVVQEFEAAMVLIANCGEIIPPLIKLGQDVTPYDGMLDVIALKARSLGTGIRAVWDVVREAQGTYGEDVFAARVRGSQITIRTPDGPQPAQVDGESVGDTPLTVTAMPGAIQLIHPRG
jgi:YegS/Rv2252/BmrU family lipid kinase